MKIVVIATDGFGGYGGIAQYTRDMLTALCAHSASPQVVALPRIMPLPSEPLPRGLVWDAAGVGSNWSYARAVGRTAYRHHRADLILCTHVHLLPVAAVLRAMSGAPLGLFVYGYEVKQPTSKPLSNLLVPTVDAIISIREHTTTRLGTWANVDGVPKHLLYNPIHLEDYGEGPKPPDLLRRYGLEGKTVLLTVGRVEEAYKGFDEVLEIMPRLREAIPDVAYVIAGGGYDVPRLREKARQLGVLDQVVFTGRIDEREKADHYRLADAYVMAGRSPEFDRYPLRFVFLEAMACGIPVVGARPEVEEESRTDGTLLAHQVDPFSADELFDAVVKAVREPRRVPPELGRFGFETFQARLHAIVDGLLEARAGRAA